MVIGQQDVRRDGAMVGVDRQCVRVDLKAGRDRDIVRDVQVVARGREAPSLELAKGKPGAAATSTCTVPTVVHTVAVRRA